MLQNNTYDILYLYYINDLHYIICYFHIILLQQIVFTREFFDDMKFCKINLIYVMLRFFQNHYGIPVEE